MASLLVDDAETLVVDNAPADEPADDNPLEIEELVVDDLLGDTRSEVVNEVTVLSEEPSDDVLMHESLDLPTAQKVVLHFPVSERRT